MRHLVTILMTLTLAASTLPAQARPQTKADIIRNHHFCLRYLKLSKAKKQAFARQTPHTPQTITKSCQFTTRMGIEKTWYYERMYQRETAGGGSSRSAPRREESSPATAGTCYDLSSCAGSSVHVSAKYHCPSGYGSFKPDLGGGGCETR